MNEFLASPVVFWSLIYTMCGCLYVKIADRGRTTSVMSWFTGVVLWLPIVVIGTALGLYYGLRRRK